MKTLVLSTFSFLLLIVNCNAQIFKNKDKEGKIHFFSATPVENIEATTLMVNSLINTSTDSIIFSVPITSFKFEKSLMEEHFNENYMESEKYPKATLRGKINDHVDFKKDGQTKVTANCNLTIHGITKLYTLTGIFNVKGNEVHLVSKFDVKLPDHNIEVPKLVVKNISESIAIDVDITYAPFVKK